MCTIEKNVRDGATVPEGRLYEHHWSQAHYRSDVCQALSRAMRKLRIEPNKFLSLSRSSLEFISVLSIMCRVL